LSSRAFFELGKKDKAFKHLSSALSLAQEKSYDHFLIKERGWLPACIKKSPLNRQTNDYLNKIFRNELKHDPAVLKICLLGRFKLSVGKTKIPLSKWKNSKALMILKYLAASRDQGFTPREVLIEMLWPDGDIRKTGKRFNVAMSALRKTLEPDLPAKAPSSYIERKKDAYRLFSDKRNDIDIDAFAQIFYEAKIKTKDSQKAFDLYLKALCLYPGPFLEEDRYENWCIEKRQLFNENYLTALNAILCFLEKNKKYDQAIIYAKKILETDPWDEMIYKKLMNFYASLGNTPNIIKIYHAYLKSAEDLDIPVNSEIEKLYQVLVRG
ncbi:MAG: transcriptional regulator, partial [Desulfobacteraceae bacterium]|nr:transcriptional regulator [Desulfobacteraceae bacterium]